MPGKRSHVDTSGEESVRQNWLLQLGFGSSQRVNPLRSLPARLSVFVLCTTLVASLIVTGISVQAIDTFLKGKIELKFPEIAEAARNRLSSWYGQQIRDLDVLAASDIIIDNVENIEPSGGMQEKLDGARDVAEYLDYVRDRFSHFDSLFVLRPDGVSLVSVGRDFSFPRELMIELSIDRADPRPRLIPIGDDLVQIVSVRITARDGDTIGLLAAVMSLDTLSDALHTQRLGETGQIFLLDTEGHYLSVGRSQTNTGVLADAQADAHRPGSLTYYVNKAGNRVVSYSLDLSQPGLRVAVEESYSAAFAPLLSAFRRILSINIAVVLFLSFAAYRVAVSIVRPIEALSEAARRIAEDEEDVQIPENHARDEVGLLTRTFSKMTSRLASKNLALEQSQAETERAVQQMREQNDELQRVNEVLEQLSITDGLTKLHNHRYFQEQLVKEVKRTERLGDPLALILIDIDLFKKWNDYLGHAGGDEILRKVAQIMNGLVRETDTLARYGGEEFAVILPKTDIDGAMLLAEKIRTTISEGQIVLDLPSQQRPLTVSVGVNVYRGDKQSLFAGADQALYRAKDAGRDCVMCEEFG